MFLLACERAKTISCIHSEINEITGHSCAALGHIGWVWFSAPLNAGAVRIDQLRIEPLHNDLLIIGGVRAVARSVWCGRLGVQSGSQHYSKRDGANQRLRDECFHGVCLPSSAAASPAYCDHNCQAFEETRFLYLEAIPPPYAAPDVIASHHNAAFFDNSARGTSCLLAVNKLFLAISVVTLLVSSVSALGDETRAETSLQSGVSGSTPDKINGPANDSPALQQSMQLDPAAATKAWLDSVPQEKREKSDAYFEGGYWLLLWNYFVAAGISILLLVSGISASLRDFSERLTKSKILRLVCYVIPYVLLVFLVSFPLNVYEHFFREHQYGLATQNFPSWFRE